MKQLTVIIKDELGLHARPAGAFVKCAGKFKSNISVKKGEKLVDGKKLFALMSLAAKFNDEITIIINGEDEDLAFSETEEFIKNNL